MSMFLGRICVGQSWTRIIPYHPPAHGYFGRPIPPVKVLPGGRRLLQGETTKQMTTDMVVNQWIKSLKAEGRSVSVEEVDGWITVRSPAED